MKFSTYLYTLLLMTSLIFSQALVSCTAEDECENVTCQNGGTCTDGTCDCPDGFTGANCENEDSCVTQNISCQNGGTCVDGTCDCPDGFSGANCENEDACITQAIDCLNGGTCIDGTCDCPAGFYGDSCETLDLNELQAILNAGTHTPYDLALLGVSLDELYGKTFNGGLIFYIDDQDSIPDLNGLIVSMEDQGSEISWGCELMDIKALPNIAYVPDDIPSTRIGDGISNTDIIIDNCAEEGIAARVCRGISEDWFLPSKAELNLVYEVLHINGLGNFSEVYYWTSTEADYSNPGVVAWGQDFSNGYRDIDGKNGQNSVRAVSKF